MRFLRLMAGAGASLAMVLSMQSPAMAQGTAGNQPLVIGVDHADPANQQPDQHRVFEYTDFFTRSATVHTGDTVDFRYAPGSFHYVTLAPSEAVARQAYPVGSLDREDPVKAIGSGGAKIEIGPGQYSITNGNPQGGGTIGEPNAPPPCGVAQAGQAACTFKGGNDIESNGGLAGFDPQSNQPATTDWKIQINAPPGKYTYFCYIHPGMSGTLTVVGADQPATTQAQIDSATGQQFAADQAAGLAAEKAAGVVNFTGGTPGQRTYQVQVGVAAADNHVAIDEMLPSRLPLVPGDRVNFVWQDQHNVHTVSFPDGDPRLPSPFGIDCGATFQSPPNGPPAAGSPPFTPCVEPGAKGPEFIFDPGTAPSGTALADPSQLADSGVLIGSGYGLTPPAQQWSIVISPTAKAGVYTYECTIHEGMAGTFTVAAGGRVSSPPAQTPAQIPAQMPNTGAGGTAALFGGLALLGLLVVGLGTTRLASRR
jgi:plastocyanin